MGNHDERCSDDRCGGCEVATSPTPWPTLTDRERAVAVALVRGVKNAEVAAILGISTKTVDTHRMKLLKKIGVRSNVELTRRAFALGWTRVGDCGVDYPPAIE